jgi:hypothetical protein
MFASMRLAKDEVLHLAAFLGRILGWDERSAVRIVQRGKVLGFYSALPMDVLAFIALPALIDGTHDVETELDVTVSAGRLRDIIGDTSKLEAVTDIRIPDPVAGSPALAVLPPAGPWSSGEKGMAGDLAPVVDAAVAEFRAQVPKSGSLNSTLLAESTWDAPGYGALPMRALHAARLLGFLSHPGARIETGNISGWKRLVTPSGQIFVRSNSMPAKLSLVPKKK